MDCFGLQGWLEKYGINCSQGEYNRIGKVIPLSLIQLIKNTLLYSNGESVQLKLIIKDY